MARGAFWIASFAGQRLRNLVTRPYASLVVLVGRRGRHRMVTADGPVTLYTLEAVRGRLEDAWSASHGGRESWPTWAATMLELRPERVYSYESPAYEAGADAG